MTNSTVMLYDLTEDLYLLASTFRLFSANSFGIRICDFSLLKPFGINNFQAPSANAESNRLITPAESTFTQGVPPSPLESAFTKTPGVYPLRCPPN